MSPIIGYSRALGGGGSQPSLTLGPSIYNVNNMTWVSDVHTSSSLTFPQAGNRDGLLAAIMLHTGNAETTAVSIGGSPAPILGQGKGTGSQRLLVANLANSALGSGVVTVTRDGEDGALAIGIAIVAYTGTPQAPVFNIDPSPLETVIMSPAQGASDAVLVAFGCQNGAQWDVTGLSEGLEVDIRSNEFFSVSAGVPGAGAAITGVTSNSPISTAGMALRVI